MPKETWWAERGVNLNEEQTRAAVRKALASERLGSRERALIEFMLKIAEDVVAQYNRADETLQETGNAQALQADDPFDLAVDLDEAGLDFTSDNIVDSELVAAAMQANPAAVEAIPDSLEPAAFMARIREIIDGTQPQPAAQEGSETGAQAPVLETYSQADLEDRDKAVEEAAAKQRTEDEKAERKAKADRERDDFTLTGSDLAADANPGQANLLSGRAQSIQDVGEKIGGARKDMAVSAGPRASTSTKDDSPGWRKRYSVSQIVKDSKAGEEGRWVIRDARSKDWTGQPRQIGTSFATQTEAEAAVPLVEVARNHRVGYTKDENGAEKYVIWRNVTDRKRVQVVQQLFDSDAEAKRYMAERAIEIIETRTSFGEEILPRPDRVRREGPARREGDVTGEDFRDAFGFKAVEFGDWEAQDERQAVMNHAYDALMDLADVLGVPPAALGLNGELALAFGARGQGLSGARAHYERDYGVINLTKMRGAGSLAHEWMHAADHYFGRQDGKASSQREKNERGDMVWSGAISAETLTIRTMRMRWRALI